MKQTLLLLLILASRIANAQDECVQFLPENIALINQHAREASPQVDVEECYTYKIAIHVIHTGEESVTNVTDEQIETVWENNNHFFANTGATAVDTAPSTPFQFVIDTITRTNGIEQFGDVYDTHGVRIPSACPVGEGVSLSAIQNHFENNRGFPSDEHWNLYVYKTVCGTGIIGFAWIATPQNGTWMRYDYMFNNARTLSHEAGHTLGLYHTFQSTPSCNSENNCEIEGDRICDTPVETLTYHCGDVCGENSRNHMGYRGCRDQFTEGQIERALAVVNNPNTGFGSYLACPECTVDLTTYGDFNGDGVVNIADFAAFSVAYGTTEEDENWNPLIDANCDGVINLADFSPFSANYGNDGLAQALFHQNLEKVSVTYYNTLGQEINPKHYKGLIIAKDKNGLTVKFFSRQ